tara:strand:+ start:5030 stop:5539 length:510 start_codon:yes stop_codon:yes gene_type:complete
MIHLINGRGQVGEQLKQILVNHQANEEIYIYHTWNVQDKTEGPQKEEYKKLQSFVDTCRDQKIIFISTKSDKETWYTHYKQLAEAYVLLHCKQSIIVRLPTIAGKGIIEQFQKNEARPYGMMELVTANMAAKEIINLCSFAGLQKSFTINGDIISAELAYDLSRRGISV